MGGALGSPGGMMGDVRMSWSDTEVRDNGVCSLVAGVCGNQSTISAHMRRTR